MSTQKALPRKGIALFRLLRILPFTVIEKKNFKNILTQTIFPEQSKTEEAQVKRRRLR